MMTDCPWKVSPKPALVEDEHGNSMQVPTYGSWLVDEIVAIQNLYDSDDVKGLSDIEVYAKATAMLLHSREVIATDSPDELKGMPLSLLLAVWKFLQSENESLGGDEGKKGKRKASQKSTTSLPSSPPIMSDSEAKTSDVAPSDISANSSEPTTKNSSNDLSMKAA